MIITLDNSKYKIVKRSKTKNYGYIVYPSDKNKFLGTIGIRKGLVGKDELDTYLHEMLHGCAKFGDEAWVHNTASDLANALWDLGYRKYEEKDK